MKEIITAIGNEKLNNILRMQNKLIINNHDIQYQEGIIEALDKYPNTDMVILSEDIMGDLELEDLILSITIIKNDIEIVLIAENKIIENKNIIKIISDKSKYIQIILEYILGKEYIKINNEFEKEQIKQSDKHNLQVLSINKNVKIEKIYKKIELIKEFKNKIRIKLKKQNKEKQVIIFIGNSGVGKTTILSILSKLARYKKTLVIDFNLLDNNINSVFGVRKYPKNLKDKIKDEEFLNEFRLNENNIKKLIVKVNNKIDLIANTKVIFDDTYICNKDKIKNILDELKKSYDLILIDSSSDTKYKEIINCLINVSDKVICIVEGNLICVHKCLDLLNDNYKNKNKIEIIYNKKNKYTMNKKMFEMLFLKYKVIGTLSYDNKYNQIINKNINTLYINNRIKKEFKDIIKKILLV